MIQADGAPVDQGRAQGRSMHGEIASGMRRLRSRYGVFGWRGARARAMRTSGLALARQLPQQRERMEGIAAAAGVSVAALTLAEGLHRIQGAGFQRGSCFQASFEVPLELEPELALRASRPDAGGFSSVELTAASFAGCLAGVNSEGIAAICLADRRQSEVSLRFLAQELIFRSRHLEAAVEHLRRRAAYLGGAGLLLVGDATGASRWLEVTDGVVRVKRACSAGLAREPSVRLDTRARTLVWAHSSGEREASALA